MKYLKSFESLVSDSSFKDNFQEVVDLGIGEIEFKETSREKVIEVSDLYDISISEMAELYKVLSFCNDRISSKYDIIFRPKESYISVTYTILSDNDEFIKIDQKEFDLHIKGSGEYKPSRNDFYQINSFLVNYKPHLRTTGYDLNPYIGFSILSQPMIRFRVYDDVKSHTYYLTITKIDNYHQTDYYKFKNIKTLIKYLDETY